MYDSFNRRINYLRISVTDLCNLRCDYCMPPEGVQRLSHADILSFEEIIEVASTASRLGIDKIRLTGGEPLVRRGIVSLVRMLAAIEGVSDLAMTSNGIRLPEFALPLRQAGLHRVNISLDAINPDHYRAVTRGGDVAQAMSGIDAAMTAGLRPVKINCVVRESPEEPDARDVARHAASLGLEVRFIRRMDTGKGQFWRVIGGDGGDCASCNRLRLSSDGIIFPCLFNDLRFSVRQLGAEPAIRAAVETKPKSGQHSNNHFYAIGG